MFVTDGPIQCRSQFVHPSVQTFYYIYVELIVNEKQFKGVKSESEWTQDT